MNVDARRGRGPSDTARFETDGIVAGLLAGGVMLIAALLLSALSGAGAFTPLRYAASIVMREHAFAAMPLIAIVAGLSVHVCASALFGHLFGLVASDHSRFVRDNRRDNPSLMSLLGATAGLGIWAIDIQLMGRMFYPWFLAYPLSVLLLHVVAFGIVLGVVFRWLRNRRAFLGQEPIEREAH